MLGSQWNTGQSQAGPQTVIAHFTLKTGLPVILLRHVSLLCLLLKVRLGKPVFRMTLKDLEKDKEWLSPSKTKAFWVESSKRTVKKWHFGLAI
jgi:hypothetical protein